MVDVENAKLLANQHVKLAVVLPTKLAKTTKKVSNKEMPTFPKIRTYAPAMRLNFPGQSEKFQFPALWSVRELTSF